MSQIIYTETEENRAPINNGFNVSQVNLDRKYTVWQDASKVSISCSVLRSGGVRGTDKRWYKWGTTSAFGFRYSKRGNVIPYQIDRAESMRTTDLWHNRRPIHAFAHLAGSGISDEITEHFQRAMRETFGVKELADIYPLARYYDIQKYEAIPNNLRAAFRQSDIRDAAVVAFGKTRVTPEWSIAMEETDPYIIAVAEQFRGYATNQSVLGFMKNNEFDDEMEQSFRPHTPRLRPFVRKMHPHSYEPLMSTKLDNMDLKRIQGLCGEGMNIKYMLGKLPTSEPVNNWTELLDVTTGRIF